MYRRSPVYEINNFNTEKSYKIYGKFLEREKEGTKAFHSLNHPRMLHEGQEKWNNIHKVLE